jgi:Domain of unknown function (DUF4116)
MRAKEFIIEYLTPSEQARVAKWRKRTKKATKATNHFFGGDDIEDIHEPLVDLDSKSEVHRAIEKELGAEIPPEQYKTGMIRDKSGKQQRIGTLISEPSLRNAFKTDNTRKNVKSNDLTVHTTRSPVGIAGQTSHGQSWQQASCKNFNDGSARHFLCHEVQHGTVVAYLKDKDGTELARGTLQPYINDKKIYVYRLDAYYGDNNPVFKKYLIHLAKRLSQPHRGGNIYQVHPKVHDNISINSTISPTTSESEVLKMIKNGSINLTQIPEELRTPEICKLAVSQEGWTLGSVPKQLRTPEICKLAVSQEGRALNAVPFNIRTPELCKLAVSQNGRALLFVPEELKTPEICKIAVSQDGVGLLYVPEELITPELCKIAVGQNGNVLWRVPLYERTPEICKIAVSQNGDALQYVPTELKTLEICKIAVRQDNKAIKYVPTILAPEVMEWMKKNES